MTNIMLAAATLILACAEQSDVTADAPEMQIVRCTVAVSPVHPDLAQVSLRWICPLGELASGNFVVSSDVGGWWMAGGGLYACGSTSVAFVPSSGAAISASGDIAVRRDGPHPCDLADPWDDAGQQATR